MDTNQVSPRLYQALQFVFALHGHDSRKASPVPYLAHLLSVCALVQQDGGDEDEAIAALLHDALEDKPEETSREDILERFGGRVLALVEAATDTRVGYAGGPKEPWQLRKQRYLEHVRLADPSMLRVGLADKVDNARSILADHTRIGDRLWERFNRGRADQQWYYTQAVKAFEAAGCRGPLLDELKRLVELISRL